MKLSKFFLVLTSTLMVVLCMILFKINNSDIKITEIAGDKSALSNATIISETIESMYQVKEININKDGIKNKNFTFSKPVRFGDEDDIVTSSNILNYNKNNNKMYKIKDRVGTMYASLYYNDPKKSFESELIIDIDEENVNTKKVNRYIINLGNFFDDSQTNVCVSSVPVVYKDDLYAVIGVDIDDFNKTNKFEGSADISRIYVYKLDLENETSDMVLVKDMSEDGYYGLGYNISFSKDDTAYFVNEKYSKDKNNKNIITFELLSFNIKTRTFNTIELGENINDTGIMYIDEVYIIDNKAYLINEYNYDNNKFKIKEIEVDLEKNKVTNKDKTYVLDIDENTNDVSYSLQNIRCIDNKLFISIQFQEYEYSSVKSPAISSNYVFVVDRESKETLYAVKIEAGLGKNSTISVVNE